MILFLQWNIILIFLKQMGFNKEYQPNNEKVNFKMLQFIFQVNLGHYYQENLVLNGILHFTFG